MFESLLIIPNLSISMWGFHQSATKHFIAKFLGKRRILLSLVPPIWIYISSKGMLAEVFLNDT